MNDFASPPIAARTKYVMYRFLDSDPLAKMSYMYCGITNCRENFGWYMPDYDQSEDSKRYCIQFFSGYDFIDGMVRKTRRPGTRGRSGKQYVADLKNRRDFRLSNLEWYPPWEKTYASMTLEERENHLRDEYNRWRQDARMSGCSVPIAQLPVKVQCARCGRISIITSENL